MNLFYDSRDDQVHEKRGSKMLYWLDDLGAKPLSEAVQHESGYLFAGARSIEDYRRLVRDYPAIWDRPEDRAPLLRLDTVLDIVEKSVIDVPRPKTWRLPLDVPLPSDLKYPLFVRTAESSWKRGGRISKVRNEVELKEEATALRRALGWDALILAREWLNLAKAGDGRYGHVPQEVRVWVVDGTPIAWSFHYLNLVEKPAGFPPSTADLTTLVNLASKIGSLFCSRLVAADFARTRDGQWCFIEAGPGSCAGTEHEQVFKAVAKRLRGEESDFRCDRVGGLF